MRTEDLGLIERLHSSHLSPGHRRIARYVLANPHEASFLSANELAIQIGVSQPSMSRFAQAIGFDRYSDMRRELRAALQDGGEVGSEPLSAVQRLVQDEISNLSRLQESLGDLESLRRSARLLADSRPLLVIGQRVSEPLASLFAFYAGKAHPHLVKITDCGSAAKESIWRARNAGARAALVISLPRYARETQTVLEELRAHSIKIVLLTDSTLSPYAELADEVLAAPVSTDFAFDSSAAPHVLLMLLLNQFVDSLPVENQRQIEEFDEIAQKGNYFVS